MGAYGATPVAAHFDRALVIAWAGPQAEDVLFVGHDPMGRAAVHEAGHAVTSWRFSHGIANVSIDLHGNGITTNSPMGVDSAEGLRLYVRENAKGTDIPTPARRLPSDARRAVTISRLLRTDRKASRELVRVRRFEARLLVYRDAELILAVAAELLKAGSLTGIQVESIIAATMNGARERRLRELGM